MHRVGLIVPHGFQLLSLAPLTAFEMTGIRTREAASGPFPLRPPPVVGTRRPCFIFLWPDR